MIKINVAIFASGSGTNAEEFFRFFKSHDQIKIVTLYSNNSNAYALTRALNHGVKTVVFNSEELYRSDVVIRSLETYSIDFIVLAGFMWLVPKKVVQLFPNRIINIHPALLPDFGGKGMYGDLVHKSVINSGNKQSGITIHYVNQRFDEGEIIFQAHCDVDPDDTPGSLATKIHQLEYANYPVVSERIIVKAGKRKK